MDRLRTKNPGCLLNFGDNNDDDDLIFKLAAWCIVLKVGITSAQVWSKRTEFINLACVCYSRKNTNFGLVLLLNVVRDEIF